MGDPRYCPDDPGCSRILEPYYSDPKNTVCDDCLWTSSAMHGSFGVVAEHPLGRHASLVFEPMYVGKGGRGHDQFFGWNYEGSGTIHSIDLPVFVKLGLDGGRICPYLLGGPALGLRIGSRAKSTVERSGQSRHAESDVRDTKLLELGLALGGGVELPIRQICLFIESQYTVGLTPLFGIANTPTPGAAASRSVRASPSRRSATELPRPVPDARGPPPVEALVRAALAADGLSDRAAPGCPESSSPGPGRSRASR
jgi:hypothetical protein